jgi:hypothetical protein
VASYLSSSALYVSTKSSSGHSISRLESNVSLSLIHLIEGSTQIRDIGILPEGQLNPYPEQGLRSCFSEVFTLAKFSKRPIHMMALNGCHKFWHPRVDIGMTVTGTPIKARVYEGGRRYSSSHEFLETFHAVVGYFGAKGRDMPEPELQQWLEGTEYQNRIA